MARKARKQLIVGGATAAFLMAALIGVHAQQAPAAAVPVLFKRTIVLPANDLSTPGLQVVQGMAEVMPGGESGRHTHPGEEIFHVIEGTFVLERDGMPPRTFTAGDSFVVMRGTIHNAKNVGTAPAKILATYVIDAGKPPATNVP